MTLTLLQQRTIARDAELGMTWWNRLTERERAEWLRRANTAVPAEAWEAFKRSADQPVAPHKHRGSVTVDRGETCLDCGRDMSDPVHTG